MPYADSEAKKEYMRGYMRKKRQGVDPTTRLTREWRIKTAEDLREVLEQSISDVMNSDIDILTYFAK